MDSASGSQSFRDGGASGNRHRGMTKRSEGLLRVSEGVEGETE
jgi:hypothetical protein